MRLPYARITAPGLMITLSIIIVAAIFVSMVVEASDGARLTCFAVAMATFSVFLIIVPFDPLLKLRRRSPNSSASDHTGDAPRGFQVGVAQMMGLIMSAAIISWFAVLLGPIVSSVLHRPTNAEMAERLGHDAVNWKRKADENPSLAKEYLRLADKSMQAADRLYRMSKGIKP